MADAIAVINAGSSSIKFSLFAERDGELEIRARGQVEGIYTAPHFVAGTGVEIEIAVEHRRKRADAVVTVLPFFDPPRKKA